MRVMNFVPSTILRSPLHRVMSRSTMLLTFTGRRTGRSYTIPVVFYQDGDKLLVTTDSGWWHNLAAGAEVVVRLSGRDERGLAVAEPDPERVLVVLQEMVRRYPGRYRRLAAQHARPGAARRVVIEITLNPTVRP
jgi:deazaflavin-dependent oxidoreductase (nitroreductase family)